jgi:hypothetical protein
VIRTYATSGNRENFRWTRRFQRDFGFQRGGKTEDDAAFHLRFDDVGVDDAAAVTAQTTR